MFYTMDDYALDAAASPQRTSISAPTVTRISGGGLQAWLGVRVSERVLDTSIGVALFLGALAIRLPYLMLIPTFTDETVEVLRSLSISQGKLFPLTNADPYYGAIYNYVVAGVFHWFGPSAVNARLTVTLLGSLAVPLAFFFAKATEDRLTGIVVALLMLTSGALIVNGHIAWENEMTPFFATATLLAFALALRRASGRLLILSGFLYGVTLQTHPGVIVLAPGLLLSFVYAGLFPKRAAAKRTLVSWLKSPWPYLALTSALVGYGNIIVQNMQAAIAWTAAQKHTYAYVDAPTVETYLTNMQNFGLMALRMVSSSFGNSPVPIEYLLQPLNILYLGVLFLGIIYAFRRGRLMPVIVLATVGLVLPYFNKSYGYPGAARYVGYLFPLLYLLIAVPLVQAVRKASRSGHVFCAYVWLLTAFLILSPALELTGYYRVVERAGTTNERVLMVYQTVRREYLAGDVTEIIIDKSLSDAALSGGGNVQRAEDYLLTLDGTPHRTVDLTQAAAQAALRKASSPPPALVLTAESYRTLSSQVRLSTLAPAGGQGGPASARYGAYKVGPSTALLSNR